MDKSDVINKGEFMLQIFRISRTNKALLKQVDFSENLMLDIQ